MKGNELKVLAGVIVVALIIIAATYKFSYSENVNSADAVKNETTQLSARLVELNEKISKRSMYQEGISNSSNIIDTILALYGPGNTPEKTIMMVVDLCQKTGGVIRDIAFFDDTLVYSSEEMIDETTPKIQVFKGGSSFTVKSGYTQLKKIFNYINSYPERMNIENFNIGFDPTTGLLSTTMSINQYSVKDDKHVYTDPVIEDIPIGTENIFKTSELLFAEEETEEGLEGTTENNATVASVENTSETTSESGETE